MTDNPTPDSKPWNKLKVDEKKALDPKRLKKEQRKGLVVLGVLGVIVAGCVASAGGGDEGRDTVNSTGSTASSAPRSSQAPTPPAAPVTPAAAFEKAVRKDLGDSNRDGVTRVESVTFTNGLAQVRFAANENVTEGLTKTGARIDTLDVIKRAKDLPGLVELSVIVTYSLQNQLGEVSEEPVGNVTYSADVVSRINVDTIEREAVWDVADVKTYTHPAFAY